jgi:DNA-binding CsgD family transcriptional regulator
VNHLAIAHLVFERRIISAVLLFRNSPSEFSADELDLLRGLVPALSVSDAAWQARTGSRPRGLPTQLECRDQRLTPRQRDVVLRVALGHTNREIAQALGLSENTVRNALVEVRRRLGAANRADIVRLAVLD